MIPRIFRYFIFRSGLGCGLLLGFSGAIFIPMAAPPDCRLLPPSGKTPTLSVLLDWIPCEVALAQGEPSRPKKLSATWPQAPGYWSKEILAWSKSAPRLSPADSGFGLALGLLPDLGSPLWREAGETRLALGDTASAGLLWLRGAASDSQFIRYAQYRLKTVLQPAVQDEETIGNENSHKPQALREFLPIHLQRWLYPWTWHTANSILTLEQALWLAHRPEAAMSALRLRLVPQSNGKKKTAWLYAGQQAMGLGRPDLAMAALANLEPLLALGGGVKSGNPKEDLETLALALRCNWVSQNYKSAGAWVEKYTPRLSAMASEGGMSFEIRSMALEAALRDGRLQIATTWLAPPWPQNESEMRELFLARLYLGLGQVDKAERLLEKLKQAPRERFSNGTLLYAQGWVAGWQGLAGKADSLWGLASAYIELPETQRALELRRLAMLDSGKIFGLMIQAQPEAPLPVLQKIEILQGIPRNSPFWPEAQWQKADYALGMGQVAKARQSYEDLVKSAGHSRYPGAKARLAFLWESQDSAKAIAAYQSLLVESQQGVPAEFSRERLRQLGL